MKTDDIGRRVRSDPPPKYAATKNYRKVELKLKGGAQKLFETKNAQSY